MSRLRAARDHLALAVPLCVGHLGTQLMAVVDSAFLGHYSGVALAGSGVGGALILFFSVIGMGLVMGLDTLLPQALGAGEHERAHGFFRAGLRLALIIGVPLTGVVAVSPLLLDLFGVHSEVAAEGTLYVYGRLPSIVPYLIFAAQRSYLQALGVTRPLVVAMVVSNLLNVVLDALLVFGDGALEAVGLPGVGLPALGTIGAALATSVVTVVGVGIAGAALRQLALTGPAPRKSDVRLVARIGAPVGGHLVAEVGIFALTGLLAGRLGERAAAAHQVALILASFSFASALGMAAATSVRVGRAVGAGDAHAARQNGRLGIALGAIIMGAAGVVFVSAPAFLARLLSDQPEVVAAAVPLLRIAALFQLSDAVQAIAAGALRGAGDTRSTFVGNVLGHYGLGIWVSVYLAFSRDLGAVGLWWGLSVGLTAVAIGLYARFIRITGRPLRRV